MKKLLVIMAAGLGSRYGGIKQIARLGPDNEILMEYAIFDAIKAGFNKIVIIIKPDMLEDVRSLFGDRISKASGIELCYAFQRSDIPYKDTPIPEKRSKPLGTVHAILSAQEYIDSAFAVINADDYYGPSALRLISHELEKLNDSSDAAMVAYSLKNTVSPFGSVTRGICLTENGVLKKVRETYNIRLMADGSIKDEGDAASILDPDSPVSMNMWGFHQDIIAKMDAYFRHFLENLDPNDNKSECLLPIMIDELISHGQLRTTVLSTDEQWFGLTYKEDTPGVIEKLLALHEKGVYPPALWA